MDLGQAWQALEHRGVWEFRGWPEGPLPHPKVLEQHGLAQRFSEPAVPRKPFCVLGFEGQT